MAIIYREEKGAPLTTSEIDSNFRTLATRLGYIEDGQVLGVEGISRIEQEGNLISFIGTQGTVFGPVALPSGLSFKGDWGAGTFYYPGDVVLNNGSSYVAVRPHTAASSFGSDLELQRWNPLAYRGSDGTAGSRWVIEYGHPEQTNPSGFRAGVDVYVDALTRRIYERDPATMEWTERLTLGASTASEVQFDNSGTSFTATDVQGVLIEIEARLQSGPASFDGGIF